MSERPLNWQPVVRVMFFVTVLCVAIVSRAFTVFCLTFAATCLILMEIEESRKKRRRMPGWQASPRGRRHRSHPRTRWSDR